MRWINPKAFVQKGIVTLLAVWLLLTVPALGQVGGDYDASWTTIDCGGGESTGGKYTVVSTFGQADAGTVSGGKYTFEGGFLTQELYEGRTWYVDNDAPGNNDGTSWEDAFNCLQDALGVASSGDEIWVARGIYTPDSNSADPNGSGDREATFQLVNGVVLKGGYAGFGESDPNEQNVGLYETILSGDLNGDDEPNFTNYDENSYHVVSSNSVDDSTIIDGFTITAGNANGLVEQHRRGGGMLNFIDSDPTVTNCTFSNNLGVYAGGGMFNYDYSDPTVTNCTFNGNSVDYGGGMCNWQYSTPTVTNCIFSGNVVDGMGGGMFNHSYSEARISNCTFNDNSGNWDAGGGMCNWDYSTPTVTNCIFSNNSARKRGGGMFNVSYSNPTITNCTFSGNSATEYGGGMYNSDDSTPAVTNCIFWGNIAPSGTEIYDQISSATVTYSNVQGGWEGVGNIDTDPCFADPCTGDYHLRPVSPCIDAGDNNSIPADTADLDGDGNTAEPIPLDLDGNPRTVDGDNDGNSVVDMGAYEYNPFVVSFVVDHRERRSRTVFRYTCRVSVDNLSPGAVENVQLELLSVSGNMEIIDPCVTFAHIEAWGSATSEDTCTFDVNRIEPIRPAEISWRATYQIADSGESMQQMSSTVVFLEPVGLASGDITGEGVVDIDDLVRMADDWLGSGSLADIYPAPPYGDDIVNFQDFAVLADNWLLGE